MPQMAPMWWTCLYFSFLLTFLMILILMYFVFMKTNKVYNNIKLNKNLINWKW